MIKRHDIRPRRRRASGPGSQTQLPPGAAEVPEDEPLDDDDPIEDTPGNGR